MYRDWKDLLKVLAVLTVVVSAITTCVLLIVKYKENIADFFEELKMKCPCAHREEDDYADDELNCIYDYDKDGFVD